MVGMAEVALEQAILRQLPNTDDVVESHCASLRSASPKVAAKRLLHASKHRGEHRGAKLLLQLLGLGEVDLQTIALAPKEDHRHALSRQGHLRGAAGA